jgi:hypothetical protein
VGGRTKFKAEEEKKNKNKMPKALCGAFRLVLAHPIESDLDQRSHAALLMLV